MTTEQFVEIVEFLEGTFRENLDDKQKDAYWSVLGMYSEPEVRASCERLIRLGSSRCPACRRGARFPLPMEILDHVFALRREANDRPRTGGAPVSREEAKSFIAEMRRRYYGTTMKPPNLSSEEDW